MNENIQDQVPLSKLIFTHNWEDPDADNKALQIRAGDTIMTITSGGCNTLGFLLHDPKKIYSVDINHAQAHLLELKMTAIKQLEYSKFMQFLGFEIDQNRSDVYQKLKINLSKDARLFWDDNLKILDRGLIMNGRYERFIRLAGKIITTIQGKSRVDNLFTEKSLSEQQSYYRHTWDTRRMRLLFKLLFNKRMLAKRGLDARYFHFDDDSNSFAESFFNRFKKAVNDNPIKGNYFLSLYLKGAYSSRIEVPEYLLEKNYDTIKSRLDRIELIKEDAINWLSAQSKGSIDCFALSNICEVMSEADGSKLFERIVMCGKPGSRIVFRNLMIPREVPTSLSSRIVKNKELSAELLRTDRSFVYSKVNAYQLV